MTGWLGNASIPGLRKGDDQQQGGPDQLQSANAPAEQQPIATSADKPEGGAKDEDDNSRYNIRYGPFSMMIDLIKGFKLMQYLIIIMNVLEYCVKHLLWESFNSTMRIFK